MIVDRSPAASSCSGPTPSTEDGAPSLGRVLLLVGIAPLLFGSWAGGAGTCWASSSLPGSPARLCSSGWGAFAGGDCPPCHTDLWGGLFLTLLIAIVGIVAAFPLGIVWSPRAALELPVIRTLCASFIELIRGVPLITVLFMASFMLPLFLPAGLDDRQADARAGRRHAVLRRLPGRGDPRRAAGDPARASTRPPPRWASATGRRMRMIILPQALGMVIPGIVNSFISLFKDTSLVFIVGLYDLLGHGQG